ncbi:MAG: hypothetical protein INF78_18320 [Roseomonas sp.]|nr:hypothetical protein [Roseomonas sp.]MCA3386684.1 hypothetical protein [Roseomonas sp.]MCA3399760.1 hypothetical protein [Roseomonas sp.]
MLSALRRLASGTTLNELAAPEEALDEKVLATRLAAALARIMTNPAIRFDDGAALRLAAIGRVSDHVHAISGFGNADYILRILGATDTEGMRRLAREDRRALAKAWLLFSVDSALPIDVRALLEAPAPLALLVAMCLISQKPILTEIGHQRREALVSLAGQLKPVSLPLSLDHLVLLSSAWMLCSYAGVRDKHGIKPVLNRVLRHWAEGIGLSDAALPATRALKARPTLLVAAEIMHSNHVQYRYFGQYLRQLRQRFRLVLVTEGAPADPHVQALFDEIRIFKREGGTAYFNKIVDDIKSIAPDMIFYLSVGMRHWGPVLANFRLAPIQFVGLGHCASTFCGTMDYYFTEQGFVGDPELLSEQLVLLPDENLIFERSPHYTPLTPIIRETAEPLRVALPSNLLKLNPYFIGVLRKIRDRARRPLEFHVFPNVSGLEMTATKRLFDLNLPGSIIYPIKRYNDYLADVNACDVNLSPFPFGGLNGVVDSFRQGIPLITLEGPDLPARLDSMMLRRLGMPEWLIARNEEEYIAAALRLIDNDKERVALSRKILELDVESVISGDATTPLKRDVVDAVWWMYQNHEAIKASGRKVFRAPDRQVFP